jgi:serine protease Do
MRAFILFFALAAVMAPSRVQAQSDLDQENELGQLRAKALDLAAQLRPSGSYLGVRLLEIDANRAEALKLPEERGVEVGSVEEGSPAGKAGIKNGDVLLTYNGENVLGVQQFIRLVQETPQGRKVKIQLWRDAKTQTLTVTTGAPKSRYELPPGFGDFPFPDTGALTGTEFPKPLVVWQNSLLGVECEPLDYQLAQYFGVRRGTLVRSVAKGSAAEKAGVKAGDVLIAIGDRPVASPHDMSSYIRSEHQSGKPIALSLVRDRKSITVNVLPPEHQE